MSQPSRLPPPPAYDDDLYNQAQRPIVRPASSDPGIDEELLRDEESSDSEEPDSEEDQENRVLWRDLPLPMNPERLPKLELPIIIPQRRPGAKMRGFARVYPPILETKGIPPAEFLSFLKDFHKEMSISPAITVLNLGIFATGFIPSWEAQVASIIAQTLVQTAAGFYSYFKADSFMKKANEEFFRPRGLLCTVVNFNPREGSGLKFGKVDIAPFFDAVAPRLRNRISEAEAVVLPDSAPLVYPPRVVDPDANIAKRTMKRLDHWRDDGASNDFGHYYPNANISPSVDANISNAPAAPTTMDRVKAGANIATTVLFNPVSSVGAVLRGKDPRDTTIVKEKRRFRRKLTDFKKKRRLAANTLYLLIVQDTTQDAGEASRVSQSESIYKQEM